MILIHARRKLTDTAAFVPYMVYTTSQHVTRAALLFGVVYSALSVADVVSVTPEKHAFRSLKTQVENLKGNNAN